MRASARSHVRAKGSLRTPHLGSLALAAPGRQIFHPDGLADGLTKSRADNFRLIPANSAVRDVLRVHAQSQIARIRAHFERFSKKCRKEWTEWWSKRDLNSRPLFIKYPAAWRSFPRNSGESLPSENLFANDSAEIHQPAILNGVRLQPLRSGDVPEKLIKMLV